MEMSGTVMPCYPALLDTRLREYDVEWRGNEGCGLGSSSKEL